MTDRKSVFLVDDEEPVRVALADVLVEHGYEVTAFPSGAEALSALHDVDVDVLLIDLMMPGMNGITLLQNALKVDPRLVCVVLTGQASVESAVEAMRCGAFAYVEKPFRISVMIPTLERAFEVRRLRLENMELRESQSVYELTTAIAFTLKPRELREKLVDAAMQQCEADEASLLVPTASDDKLEVVVARGAGRERILGHPVELDAGIAGWVARAKEAVTLVGEVRDPRFTPLFPRSDIVAAMSVPLVAAGKLVGVLNVNRTHGHRSYTQGQAKALSILAGMAASALDAAHAYEATRLAEERYHSLFDNVLEGLFRAREDGEIALANRAYARMMGYESTEELLEVQRSKGTGLLPTGVEKMVGAAKRQEDALSFEVRVLRKDGTEAWHAIHLRMVRAPDGTVLHMDGGAMDVTDRKRAEKDVEKRMKTLATVYAWSKRIQETLETRALAEEIVTAGVRELGVGHAWLGRIEPDGTVRIQASTPAGLQVGSTAMERWDDTPAGRGPLGRAIREKHVIVVDDLVTELDCPECRTVAQALGMRSSIVFPVLRQNEPCSVLVFLSRDTGFFIQERVDLFTACASQAAVALVNAAAYEEVCRRSEQLQSLRKIDMAITASLDLRVTLDVFLAQVVTQLKPDAADVMLYDVGSQTLECVASVGFQRGTDPCGDLRLGQGLAGCVVQQRKMRFIPFLNDCPHACPERPCVSDEGFVSACSMPLMAKGHVLGVLQLFFRKRFEPDAAWLEFMEALAGQAAIALDNAALFSDLDRANADLITAYETTIEGWSRALDLRDRETEGHSLRVTEVTLTLARKLGVMPADLAYVRRGALLHDLGKMGIPDGILLKPGPLTPEERVIMETHASLAFALLSPIPFLRQAIDIPYCHHEKWDGNGYPRGLKGEEIPLAARIFAIVDVWDALTNDRPYRKAMPRDEALAIIRKGSGSHFEPRIVEAFMEVVDGKQTADNPR